MKETIKKRKGGVDITLEIPFVHNGKEEICYSTQFVPDGGDLDMARKDTEISCINKINDYIKNGRK